MSKGTGKTEFEKKLERKMHEGEMNQKETDDKVAAAPEGDVEATAAESQETTKAADTPDQPEMSGAGESTAAVGGEEQSDEAAGQSLAAQLEEQAAECEQLQDQILRVRADFDNYRKRMLREMDQVRRTASANLIKALLPALDNLGRALDHAEANDGFVEGVSMVYKQFQDILAAEGLEPIPALHEPFDPNVHDALATIPSEEVESGHVAEEYERGYRLRDTILRPARVVVSSGPAVPKDDAPQDAQEAPETDDEAEQITDENN